MSNVEDNLSPQAIAIAARRQADPAAENSEDSDKDEGWPKHSQGAFIPA